MGDGEKVEDSRRRWPNCDLYRSFKGTTIEVINEEACTHAPWKSIHCLAMRSHTMLEADRASTTSSRVFNHEAKIGGPPHVLDCVSQVSIGMHDKILES